MLEFDPKSPFPLISEESHSYAEAKRHSEAADAWLGLATREIEDLISKSPDALSPQQLWIGLPVSSMLTPYTEFRRILEHLNPASEETIVDLGAGYGRLAFVLARHYPEVNFIGYELASQRVAEANRCLGTRHPRLRMMVADLSAPQFVPADAAYYFIYDYGNRESIEKTLSDLRGISRRRPITVVGRGRSSRDAIELKHPWLSQIVRPEHTPHYSIYRSASS